MRAKYWNLQTSFNVPIAAAHQYMYLQPYPYFVIFFFNKRTDRNDNGLQKLFPKETWRLEKAYADSTLCTKMPQRIQKTWTTTLEKCYHCEGERKKRVMKKNTGTTFDWNWFLLLFFSTHYTSLCILSLRHFEDTEEKKKNAEDIWYERLKIWLVTELMKRKLVKKTLDRERGNRVKYTKGWIIWISLKLVNNRMKVNERRSLVLLLFCQ